jgi:hypothetical protein
MRAWLLPLTLLLCAGCFPSFEFKPENTCPGHGTTDNGSWLLGDSTSCACPRSGEINPTLDGQDCSYPGTTCYATPTITAFSCTCDPRTGNWRCPSVTQDFSIPDLAPPADLTPSPESD